MSFYAKTLLIMLFALWPLESFAQDHSSITSARPSLQDNLFFFTSIERSFGKLDVHSRNTGKETQKWRGIGLRSGAGLEMRKFLRFNLSHTYLDMRSEKSALHTLAGSRVSLETSFVFAAPLFNLNLNGGLTADHLKYQNNLETSEMLGSGLYTSVALEHFLTRRASLFVDLKMFREGFEHESGNSSVHKLLNRQRSLGAGLFFWF